MQTDTINSDINKMIRFQHVEYLWLLLLIPLAIFVYVYFLSWRKKKIKKIGDPELVNRLFKGQIAGRRTSRFVLFCLALLCCIIGMANLQAGGQLETTQRKGLDVIFALDVSNSMLARDINPDRISSAKQFIYNMLDKMQGDRTGLVVFAGKAYLQVPLTIDYSAMKMILSSVNPGMIPTQGTVLAEALQMSNEAFKETDTKHKVIVLISDGEDHDSKAEQAAKEARDKGAIIYTVGIGSPEGSTIFDPSTSKDKVDMNGATVITKLNEAELKDIATTGGGEYIKLTNVNSTATTIMASINKMETKKLGEVEYKNFKSYFQYFIGLGIIFLLIAWLLPEASTFSKNKIVA